MKQHLDRETLRQFVSNELPSEEARLVDQHLSVCSDCRDRADEASSWLALQLLDSWLRPSYDKAFERAADRVAERLSIIVEESRNSEDLLTELLRESPAQRRRRIRTEERFQTLKLSQLLRSLSRDAWFSDPAIALDRADLAVEVALHLDPARYGANLVEDTRALAWAYLGNGFRIMSDLYRAEQALKRAWQSHVSAGEDAFTESEILSFVSSIKMAQGRFDEALTASEQVIGIYRDGQDRHLEGFALIQKALALQYLGHNEDAVPIILTGLGQIDPTQDPRLLLTGKHNLICAFAYGGVPQKAQTILEQNRALYKDVGDLVTLARFHWLSGLIARDLGHLREAERQLLGVREFFLERQNGIDVFLVSLDLAGLYAIHGQNRKLKSVLGDLIPVGEAFGLRKEVFLARLLYQRASA